jgi:copper/silver efflux system protein
MPVGAREACAEAAPEADAANLACARYLDQAYAERRERAAHEGRAVTQKELYGAIIEGAVERVRPKMMTVVAIMAGLLPIMWSHGAGSEVMQRIAVPMIGGMVSSTILTLAVIPAIYAVVKELGLRRAERLSKVPVPQNFIEEVP